MRGGLYQVGSFVGERFTEWNGRYRDDVRRFVKGDDGVIESFASRILASPDIYRQPIGSRTAVFILLPVTMVLL